VKGSFKTALVAAVVSAVVAAGAAVATTQAFTLGATNRVDAATKVTNLQSNGTSVSAVDAPLITLENKSTSANATPLSLLAAPAHAPMKVNSGVKVANLNADRLDGLDSTAFTPASAVQRGGPMIVAPDTSFLVHMHTFASFGGVDFDGICVDTGTDQMVSIALYPTASSIAFDVSERSDLTTYAPETNAYPNAVWSIGRWDGAHGTPVMRTLEGNFVGAGHQASFSLYMGQNIRGATDGKCVFGGTVFGK
jgi:hypothetical protein